MEIAVYGDSFADARNIFYTENDFSWTNCLRKKGYNVTNYGKCASSLFYSYRQFIDTHEKFDKIIFLLTGRGRFEVQGLPENDSSITYGMIDDLMNNREGFNSTQKEIVNACLSYYKYVLDDKKEELFHNLLVKEIQRIRPDGLYIPCFPNCYQGQEEKNIIDLDYFSLFDHTYFNIKPSGPDDRRYCHMNEGNNQMLADRIDQWLHTNQFSLTKEDAVNPIVQNPEYYFTISS